MPRSDEDNQQIRIARRQEILAAALGVFARKGVSGTKVADIAAAAGLSHGLLYHYFRSKEAVFETLVDELMLAADADLAPSTERAIDRIAGALERRLATPRDADPGRVVLQAVLQGEVSAELHQRLHDHHVITIGRLRDLIRRAQREGDLAGGADPDELARALVFLFRGMALDVPGNPLPLPSAATVLRLLGATQPARRGRRDGARVSQPPRAPRATRTRRTGT